MGNLKIGRVLGTSMATWAVGTPLAVAFLIWGFFPLAIGFLEWLGQF